MPRICHFEIHAENPERAITFYTSVFGWKFQQWGDQPYWLIETGPKGQSGIDGGLLPRHGAPPVGGEPVNAFVCTVDVDNLDAYSAKVTEHGATLAVPKMPIPTVGWLAYYKDTEGNIFGMMQSDPEAK
ncbi:MAG: VOC family protein [Acidobacteria bacterium]|nr:VOC family protein [Acidobacteriota bacterium]